MGCLAGSIWRRVARFGASDIRLGAQQGRLDVPQGFLGARDALCALARPGWFDLAALCALARLGWLDLLSLCALARPGWLDLAAQRMHHRHD